MDEENGAKTTDMPVYSYTCIEISLQSTPDTFKNHLINDFTIYTSMLNTWKLYHWRAGLCLFHRAISCVMAGLRALSIPYDKE